MFQRILELSPTRRGLHDLTDRVDGIVAESGVHTGLCHMFLQHTLTVPVSGGRLALGTWQAIYLFEHRLSPHRRRVVTVQG